MKGWKRKSLVGVLLLVSAACVFAGCGKKDEKPTVEEPEITLTLSDEAISVDVYDVATVTAETNSEEAIVWTAGDSSIITVEDGFIVPKKIGSTTVTATVGEISKTCSVVVRESDEVPTATIKESKISLPLGGTYETEISLKYKGEKSAYPVQWTCALLDGATEGVATVTAKGNVLTFTATAVGSTSYTVFTQIYDIPLVLEIPVNVCDASVTFASETLQSSLGGFDAKVGMIDSPVSAKDVTVGAIVYENDEIVENPEIVWEITENDGVFSFDEETGTISAVKVGEGRIVGKYKTNSFTVFVEVYRPIVKGDRITVETAVGNYVDINVATEGELQSVALNGVTIDGATMEDERVYLGSADTKLATQENAELKIETDKAFYVFTTDIYTKVLRTAEDIDAFGAIAKAERTESYRWGGHFVLGNDIAYNKVYTPFITSKTPNGAKSGSSWYHGSLNGFDGIFDGKGYNIDGMEVNTTDGSMGGFIGVVNKEGVVRNLSFTNAVLGAGQGFVAAMVAGRAEDIYVHCIRQESGKSVLETSGFFSARDTVGGSRIVRCFVDSTQVEKATYAYAVGRIHEGYGIIEGVYAVGIKEVGHVLSTAGGLKNVCGAYDSYQDMLAASINFAAWVGNFWTLRNGAPVPKNLAYTQEECVASISSDRVEAGKTLTLTLSRNTIATLSSSAVMAGITLQGNIIYIPEDVEIGVTYEVELTSVYSNQKATLSFKTVDETYVLPGENDNDDRFDWIDPTVNGSPLEDGENDNDDRTDWEAAGENDNDDQTDWND